MAELFGKETGTSHGRGGSMHLVDYSRRFMGGYGIVGGHLPLAVGGAWAVKYRKQPDVIFCMFGDGATNIGAFHESLNMAKVFDLPVVWFCVNNRYGMGTPVEKASAVADIYKRACAYDMESIQIDGMNLREVMLRTSEIVEKTRKDSVPRFIEALCYRFRGHSVVDPDKYRSAEDKEKYRKADPLQGPLGGRPGQVPLGRGQGEVPQGGPDRRLRARAGKGRTCRRGLLQERPAGDRR